MLLLQKSDCVIAFSGLGNTRELILEMLQSESYSVLAII